MKTAHVTVKLKFPAEYTGQQIRDIMENADYEFYYPVQDGEDEVKSIQSEIIDYEIKE